MKANATIHAGGREIHGVNLRDEPWEEAEAIVRQAWADGYRWIYVDDGVLMFEPNAGDASAIMEAGNQTEDQIIAPRNGEDAVQIIKAAWWPEEDV